MVIQTLEHSYHIVQVLLSTEKREIMLCRNLNGSRQQDLCIIIHLKSHQDMVGIIPLFVEQQQNKAFEDFIECFSQDGEFFIVFRYYEQDGLRRKLQEGTYDLEERLEIGKSLMSRMTMLNMPSCVQLEALNERNLVMNDALEINFNYYLTQFPEYPNIELGWVERVLAEVITLLFPAELSHNMYPDLNRLVEQLEAEDFNSYVEIYGVYDHIYDDIKQRLMEHPEEPYGLLYRLWLRIKKLAHYAKPILIGTLLVVTFAFMIYSLLNPSVPNTRNEITQIGTVTIRE